MSSFRLSSRQWEALWLQRISTFRYFVTAEAISAAVFSGSSMKRSESWRKTESPGQSVTECGSILMRISEMNLVCRSERGLSC